MTQLYITFSYTLPNPDTCQTHKDTDLRKDKTTKNINSLRTEKTARYIDALMQPEEPWDSPEDLLAIAKELGLTIEDFEENKEGKNNYES